MDIDLNTEIDRNLFAFLPCLPELLPDHEGSFALLRHQRIQSIHEKLSDALKAADSEFADGLYSIQQITDRPVDLGFFRMPRIRGNAGGDKPIIRVALFPALRCFHRFRQA